MTFALADCNNFYVSCERVFNPALRDKPVVVLSSNDGCVISRSEQAKALGITMGLPLFKARALIDKHAIAVFSSNYTLYGSMSQRVMEVIGTFAVAREVYSIDEAFLNFQPEQAEDPMALCTQIRARILQWTGIPISIGIGGTKTIAKLANRLVKTSADRIGVVNLSNPEQLTAALDTFPVGDIWGVGYGIKKTLLQHGIHTAAQLRDADTSWIKAEFGVKGLAVLLELRGQVCHELRQTLAPRNEFIITRTFGRRLRGFDQIAPAFTEFARRGAERLNAAGLATRSVTAFVAGDPFQLDPQGGSSVELKLEIAATDAADIIHYSHQALEKIIDGNVDYKKGGIILSDLSPAHIVQETFFTAVADEPSECAKTPAPETPESGNFDSLLWEQKQEYMSLRYTTNWDEIPRVC